MSKKFWSQNNKALINRGSLSLWISKDVQSQWFSKEKPKRKGRRKLYSDHLIHLALCLKYAYKLSFRSLQGLVQSICAWICLRLAIHKSVAEQLIYLIPTYLQEGLV